MRHGLKCVLVSYAETSSPAHLHNTFKRFIHFVRFLAKGRDTRVDQITDVDLLSYRSSLDTRTGWYFGVIAGLLKRWHELAVEGVATEAIRLLEGLRTQGNMKGAAVRTMDPWIGPFTDIELTQIQTALDKSFVNGQLTEADYLLSWLFMALGQRAAQYAALKVRDVRATTKSDETHYSIHVPRAKQRNAGPRLQLKDRPLIPQLGRPLYEYAQSVHLSFTTLLADPNQAPLFPVSERLRGSTREWPPGYEYHQTGGALGHNLANTWAQLDVRSERTGEPLNISPIRFRRTFGTRAAQEGHGELVIAELLDHSDTQNVGVYVAAVPEIAARIDRAIALQMAPLAQAFKGVLITDESEAIRGRDPTSRILDPRIDINMKPMGSCGQHSFCGLNAPLACYTCHHFQPWLDGPHEAVLDHLLTKRERLLATTDERIASVNDATILAVAQVIDLCRQARTAADG
jgi:integrase